MSAGVSKTLAAGLTAIGVAMLLIVSGAYLVGSAAAAPENTTTDGAAVAIEPQTTNGTNVTVASVTLPEGGFVAIHNQSYQSSENLSVETVVGASQYLSAGQHQDVEVVLDEPIAENQTITARATRDGNSNQSFDYVSSQGFLDTAYSEDGTAVEDTASIEVVDATSLAESPAVLLTNQTTAGVNATVRSVTLPEGGFVAIHDSSYLPPENKTRESLIGVSEYLVPGVHDNVTVALNTTIEEETLLLASPYRDTNGNESFEFVESEGKNDTPYAPPNATALVSRANLTINETAQDALVESRADTGSQGQNSGFQIIEVIVVVLVLGSIGIYLKVT
jgi:hypothetical protein